MSDAWAREILGYMAKGDEWVIIKGLAAVAVMIAVVWLSYRGLRDGYAELMAWREESRAADARQRQATDDLHAIRERMDDQAAREKRATRKFGLQE